MSVQGQGEGGLVGPGVIAPSPLVSRPWLKSYPPGVPAEVEIPDESMSQMLDATVRKFPHRPGLDFFGAVTTYAELGEQVRRGAAALKNLGVKRGDRVALIMPNCPQHVVAFYSALRIGAVVVEHNPLYTRDELRYQLRDSGARVAIGWSKIAGLLTGLRNETSLERVIAIEMPEALPLLKRLALRLPVSKAREMRSQMSGPIPPEVLRWERLVASASPLPDSEPHPNARDVALLQYTGGTTGTPKGAILTHRNLRGNLAQGRPWLPEFREGAETVYAVLPLFHSYGLTLCLGFAINSGARLVLLPRFDVDMMLAEIARQPPTFLPAVPPIYQRLATAAAERGITLPTIRYSMSGAMGLAPMIANNWEQATRGLLVEGYGLTETSPVVCANPFGPARRIGTVGVPIPSTEIRIVDRDDPSRDLPLGEAGELLVRGPQVFAGYWNRPDETGRVLLADGWMRTGDVAVAGPDGFVRIVDRIKELIITGGFNVYPSEVENVLREVPGVDDVAVVGLPNPEFGEEVVAAVVAAPGRTIDPADVRAYAREHLGPYKVPRRVVVMDALPRSLIGKVLHRQVRERLLTPVH